MNTTIGAKLKTLRKTKKLTQQEVADRVEIKRATISNYEINRRQPSLNDLRRLAEFYGVGLDYFGVASSDEIFEILSRASEVFKNADISKEKKDDLYKSLMRLYLDIKE